MGKTAVHHDTAHFCPKAQIARIEFGKTLAVKTIPKRLL